MCWHWTKVKLVVTTSCPAEVSGGKVEEGRKHLARQMLKCAAPCTHQALLDSRPGQSRPQLPMSRLPAGPIQWTKWRSCCWTQSPSFSHSYLLTVFLSHLQPKDSTYTPWFQVIFWQVSFSFFNTHKSSHAVHSNNDGLGKKTTASLKTHEWYSKSFHPSKTQQGTKWTHVTQSTDEQWVNLFIFFILIYFFFNSIY